MKGETIQKTIEHATMQHFQIIEEAVMFVIFRSVVATTKVPEAHTAALDVPLVFFI